MQKNEDKAKQEEKELKRLLDAHMLVLKSKHGRAPTLEELQASLGEAGDSNTPVASVKPNPGEPKQEVSSPGGTTSNEGLEKSPEALEGPGILHMKVYYGLSDKDGEKKPDPKKVLFYEHPTDKRFYSVEQQEWMDSRPSIVDHLNSRPIQYNDSDIISAIANGVMGDQDYEALDKAGMLTETPRRLWSLTKKLKEDVTSLEAMNKSAEAEEPNDSESEGEVDADLTPEGNAEPEKNPEYEPAEVSEFTGDDVFSQIVSAATDAAMTGMEKSIRKIVQEEIRALLGDSMDENAGEENIIQEEIPEELDSMDAPV